jgi:hypothetical protein
MRRISLTWITILGMTISGCGKDRDKDGYKGDDDCDDLNASVHPGADEVCDAIDNNCNGNVDEGLILEWYADKDDDGYGDLDTTVSACTQPGGYVDNSEDCDDTSDLFRPGAIENDCEDPNDYNCDGSVGYQDVDQDNYAACNDCDDNDAGTYAPTLFYIDYDGDGFGSNFITQTACSQPAQHAANDTDCDDLDPNINPTAVEICNAADDDCDGETDEAVANTYFEDADGDGYGNPSSTTDACEVPDGFAETDDDCDDVLAEVNPGAEEICDDGLDNNCDELAGTCELDAEASDVVFWGENAFDNAGMSTAGGGDLNGDGFDDIVVGAKHESTGADQAGAAYVIYGRSAEEFAAATEATDGVMSLADADIMLTGEAAADKAGRMVAIIPDVNSDGNADLLVASPSADPSGNGSGTVYLMFGGGSSGSLADADMIIDGAIGFNYTGLGLAGGDLVAEGGGSDVLIGAPGNDVGGANTGTIWIVEGPPNPGEISVDTLTNYVMGQAASDGIGDSFDVLDVNGDGQDDLVVGAPDSSEGGTNAGTVFVVHGPISGAYSLADADVQYTGESASDQFGFSLTTAGDTNDDGYHDWIAGAPFDDEGSPDSGAAYVVTGGIDLVGGSVDEHAVLKLVGEAGGDQFGIGVAGGGDVNDDDMVDFIVTAPYTGGTVDYGSAFVFYGDLAGTVSDADADVRMDGDTLGDQVGQNVAIVGDVGGSGADAFIVGAPFKDTVGEDGGGAYLMLDIGL